MAKIVFFGNERLATGVTTTAPTLRALIAEGHEVVAVVSHHEAATSRKQRSLEIADVAQQHGIPVLLPDKPSEILEQLESFGAEIGVLAAYGKIVPQRIIDIFPKGIINIHPSALPKHRGPTPLESVILAGETQTAVSVMELVKAMDAGPVYLQREVRLVGTESKQELADKLLAIGSELIIEALPRVLDGSLTPAEQKDDEATYDKLIEKSDGRIDWTKPATQLEREVRAYAGWPKSTATLHGIDVVITKATTSDEQGEPGSIKVTDKKLFVCCGDGALEIERLIPAGKQETDAVSFLNGYGKHFS